MEKDIRPIKRSAELTPLSRDHHDGLLLVWKIREGLRNGTEPALIGQYLGWFWKEHLSAHFSAEETLLPSLAAAGYEGVQRMMEEHRRLEEMFKTENWSTGQLQELATQLNDHIRFEERVLFPYLETSASPQQLKQVDEALQKEEKSNAVWENEFWLKK